MQTWQIVAIFGVAGVLIASIVIGAIFVYVVRSWKIPLIVFKLVGDRRRPVLDLTRRAKIINKDGVRRLKIRGTPLLWEMRNFKNENYYITTTGQPALVLFEFSKDCFAPMTPTLFNRKGREASDRIARVPIFTPINFNVPEDELHQLMLKAVDDFDPDFIIRNFARIDRQYNRGWRAFMHQHGWMIGWLLLFFMAIIGIIFFFIKAPELASACANSASASAEETIRRITEMMGAPGG